MPKKRRTETAPSSSGPTAPSSAPGKERPQGSAELQDIVVKLKPFLGFKPGAYLTVIYAVVLALLVYLLLFAPGLARRGQYMAVTSMPGRATVSVDGTFAGTTPCTIFVKKGEHTLAVSRPGFEPAAAQVTVRGRVFATLLVPDKVRKAFVLGSADASAVARMALADFQSGPSVPAPISEAAWATFRAPQNRAALYEFLHNCMYSVQAEPQLRELVLGGGRVAAAGEFLTPFALVSLVQETARVKKEHDNLPSWLLLSLTRENGRKLGGSPWASAWIAGYRDALLAYYMGSAAAAVGGGARGPVVQGVAFRAVPAGTLVMGSDEKPDSLGTTIDQALAHPVAVGAFYLAETEVTNRQFQAFLAENAGWQPSARDSLVSRGLATDQYLAGWTDNRPAAGTEDLPVTGVSWHAAQAYCAWLSTRAGAALPGYAVRLPTESEWEWAARAGARGMPYPLGEKPGASVLFTKGIAGPSRAGTSEANAWGLRDMVGNAWEWCEDSYAPAAYLLSSLDPAKNADLAARAPASNDKAVRGGSWNNARDQVKVYTRGSQPAAWCTPYLGFRVALARR